MYTAKLLALRYKQSSMHCASVSSTWSSLLAPMSVLLLLLLPPLLSLLLLSLLLLLLRVLQPVCCCRHARSMVSMRCLYSASLLVLCQLPIVPSLRVTVRLSGLKAACCCCCCCCCCWGAVYDGNALPEAACFWQLCQAWPSVGQQRPPALVLKQ
jgi:hypothetical protein